jgi:SET domain-containing protein
MEVMNLNSPASAIPIEQGNEFLEVRQSTIHGTGGYARKDIPAGTRIIEYVGERISKEESVRRCEADNEYIFTIDDEGDLDGKVAWNPARFINHSCTPNCEAEWDEGHIFINALRDIKQGEELSFNYGYDMEDVLDHVCQCRTAACVGYIVAEEHWDEVRKLATLPKACAETVGAGNLTA